PHVMRFNLLADRGKYARIAALLGEEVPERISPVTAGERAIAAVEKLNRDLAIPRSLREVGASEDAIDQMAEDAMKSGNILVNPRKTTLEDIKQLYRQAFH
ncbi:MAG: iron-containing alcohol dehydrogenase, partial [Clostridia bacterium]|nr:iron-containing alcohol dehydrogenase [Clostridia bacterium]